MSNTKWTTESFREKLVSIFGDRYDFSETLYAGAKTKVKVICPEHGEFWKRPDGLLKGGGCPSCRPNKKMTPKEFVKKAKAVHAGKYFYPNTGFTSTREKVSVVCPEHGPFEILASTHLKGFGCKKCSGWNEKLTTETFIEKAVAIHSHRYDYSKAKYASHKKPVTIICPEHGEFEQSAHTHLQGHGCPQCKSSKGETAIRKFLDEHGLAYQAEYSFLNSKYRFDFFLPSENLLIEFDGKQHFEQAWFSRDLEVEMKNDENKDKLAKDNGVKILRIPFWEINRTPAILESLLLGGDESILDRFTLHKNRQTHSAMSPNLGSILR